MSFFKLYSIPPIVVTFRIYLVNSTKFILNFCCARIYRYILDKKSNIFFYGVNNIGNNYL